jgi:hypothetical protein
MELEFMEVEYPYAYTDGFAYWHSKCIEVDEDDDLIDPVFFPEHAPEDAFCDICSKSINSTKGI